MKIIFSNKIKNVKNTNIRYIQKTAIEENFGGIGNLNNLKIINPAKTKNRFVHVFWSKPMLCDFKESRWNVGNQYEQTLALSALSLACLKAHGQEVVLYTDTKGKELLECLNYDKIYTIFDDLQIKNDFWAAGKIVALQNEPLDSILIDNDLFLYDGALIDALAESNVIGSHLEKTEQYKQIIQIGQNHFSHLNGANEYSTNTGIIKCYDLRKKTMFIQAYFNILKVLNNSQTLELFKTVGKGAFCPDLLAEQFNFHKICKPKHLVQSLDDNSQIKGFVHLLAFEKYLKMPIILDILQNQFLDYYHLVINKWKDLNFSVVVEE